MGGLARWTAFTVVLVALLAAGCGSSVDEASREPQVDTGAIGDVDVRSPKPPAQRLAEAQRGRPVDPNSRLVRGIQRELRALVRACKEMRATITDLALDAHQQLAGAGQEVPILRILRAVRRSIASSGEQVQCRRAFIALVDVKS